MTLLVLAPVANADTPFSCTATAAVPIETASIDAGGVLVPQIQIAVSAHCSDDAAIALKVRPEVRLTDTPFDIWAGAGPVISGTKPGFHQDATLTGWYTCKQGHYRTEGRVTAGSCVRSALATDESLSGGRSVDCKVKLQVGV